MLRTAVFAAWMCVVAAPRLTAQDHDGHSHAPRTGETAVLGQLTFENSGNHAAQAPFLRGIALLHSFEYVDAAEAFREAQSADATFALAYWMEALTTEHPLWGEHDTEQARRILARLGHTPDERLSKARSPRERGYGAAIEALFAGESGGKCFVVFADSLRRLAGAYPDDLEASAFASIASLAAAQVGDSAERARLLDDAIAHAERVFRDNQQHPGAAHYLIHAYDHPVRAARGLPFARVYAEIAPDAEHALHMPSHIFMQLGLWEDVTASNERAWAASRAWVERRALPGAHLDFHTLAWLQYGYLQQGRYRAARAIIDTARAVLSDAHSDATGGPDPLYVVTRLTFQYAAETGDWTSVELRPSVPQPSNDQTPRHQFFARADAYHRAVAAILRGETGAVAERADAGQGLLALHRNALLARRRGDRDGTVAALRRAVAVESVGDVSGPPLALVSHDLLAAALLESGQAAEAVKSYEASLERRRNRPAALLGLARARAAAGDRAGSAEAYGTLLRIWHAADADLPALAEARMALRRP